MRKALFQEDLERKVATEEAGQRSPWVLEKVDAPETLEQSGITEE